MIKIEDIKNLSQKMVDTIIHLKRKSDGKLFGVYFRTGIIKLDTKLEGTSFWISKFDDEELELDFIPSEEFEITDTMKDFED
jgi:hypothetical protein